MKTHTKRLGTACFLTLLLGVTPALAAAPEGFTGTLTGSYANDSCNGCGGHIDNWAVNGQGAFGFGPSDIGAEVDLGYMRSSGTGFDVDTWGIGGNVFWAPAFGRFGGTVDWTRYNLPGPDFDTVTYGGFGEFYASPFITVGGNVGGLHFSTTGFSADGTYAGGGITGYVMPDLGLTGAINWIHLDHSIGDATAWTVMAEWLVNEDVPVSVFGGYTNTDPFAGGSHSNTWFLGLRFYFSNTPMTLVDHHRNGSLDSLVTTNTALLRTSF